MLKPNDSVGFRHTNRKHETGTVKEKNRQTSSVYDCTVGDVEYVADILLLS